MRCVLILLPIFAAGGKPLIQPPTQVRRLFVSTAGIGDIRRRL